MTGTHTPLLPVKGDVPLYDLTPNYKQFSKHYVISTGDRYLPMIERYLLEQYGAYLEHSVLVAGFKKYH